MVVVSTGLDAKDQRASERSVETTSLLPSQRGWVVGSDDGVRRVAGSGGRLAFRGGRAASVGERSVETRSVETTSRVAVPAWLGCWQRRLGAARGRVPCRLPVLVVVEQRVPASDQSRPPCGLRSLRGWVVGSDNGVRRAAGSCCRRAQRWWSSSECQRAIGRDPISRDHPAAAGPRVVGFLAATTGTALGWGPAVSSPLVVEQRAPASDQPRPDQPRPPGIVGTAETVEKVLQETSGIPCQGCDLGPKVSAGPSRFRSWSREPPPSRKPPC